MRRIGYVDGGGLCNAGSRLGPPEKYVNDSRQKHRAVFDFMCNVSDLWLCNYVWRQCFLEGIALDGAASADGLTAAVIAESAEAGFDGGSVYANASDFFFK